MVSPKDPNDAVRSDERDHTTQPLPEGPVIPQGPVIAVAPDVHCLQLSFVNVYLVGRNGAGDRGWVLIDSGQPRSAGAIRRAAQDLFGRDARPSAIVLTHGHRDHSGSAKSLAETWDVPIYAHRLEMPYLTGRSAYPPFDPAAGHPLLARVSRVGPLDLRPRIRLLLADGSVPNLPDWRWIATPGHSPGHVSLYRDEDGVLIAGDAVATTDLKSVLAAMRQRPTLQGPPAFSTCDWTAASKSVQTLAELQPLVVAAGHGRPLWGDELLSAFEQLAAAFDRSSVPAQGRYADQPAVTDETGVVSLPPPVKSRLPLVLAGMGAAAAVVGMLLRRGGSASKGNDGPQP